MSSAIPMDRMDTALLNSGDYSLEVDDDDKARRPTGKLKTFNGVFVPCMLNIFGVILFERWGWMVGEVGLSGALMMLFVGYLVVSTTVLSLSAVATNGKMGAGGAYYLISRALGPEFGGAIGIIFYAANVFGTAVYLIGFAQAVHAAFPDFHAPSLLVACVPLVLLTIVCIIGSSLYAKSAMVVFVLVNLSLLQTFGGFAFRSHDKCMIPNTCYGFDKTCDYKFQTDTTGFVNNVNLTFPNGKLILDSNLPNSSLVTQDVCHGFTSWNATTFKHNWKPTTPYYYHGDIKQLQHHGPSSSFVHTPTQAQSNLGILAVFSIFFPAVTGIMAGANMSGDLATPGKSIPKGTMYALGASGAIYALFAVLMSFTVDSATLADYHTGYFIMQKASLWAPGFTIGLFSATLASSMASIIGGAKVLQSLAQDNVLPLIGVLGRGYGPNKEPRLGVLFTAVCVFGLMAAISDLNALATFQTLFFLLSYSIVNLSCFMMDVSAPPNWRPTFRYYTRWTALFGVVLCLTIMFATHYVNALVAVALCVLLVTLIHWRAPKTQWGAISQTLIYHQVRKYLLRLDERKSHVKFWRPQIMFLCANPRSAYRRLQFVNKLKKGGLLVIGNVIKGDVSSHPDLRSLLKAKRHAWLEYMETTKLKGFADVVISPALWNGVQNLLMTSGLGAMRPNTVAVGFFDSRQQPRDSIKSLHHLDEQHENQLLDALHGFPGLRNGAEPSLTPKEYVRILKDTLSFGKNLIVMRHFEKLPWYLTSNSMPKIPERRRATLQLAIPEQQHIDVWVLPLFDALSVNVCLMLAFVLSRTEVWKKHLEGIRLKSVVFSDAAVSSERSRLEALVAEYRIPCSQIDVIDASFFVNQQQEPPTTPHDRFVLFSKIMRHHSTRTGVCFVPMPTPPPTHDSQGAQQYLKDLAALSDGLNATCLVHGNNEQVLSTEL